MIAEHSPSVSSTGLRLAPIAHLDWRSMLAFLLPFALYLATLAPTIYNLDSAELTTAAATGGLTRATGYPLYLLLGNLWAKLPIADVGYRMNLLSAVSGALTMLFADRILRRFQIGPVATLGALGLLACAPYFWALSLIAEVYTLHTALMAAILLLLLRWAAYPSAGRLAGLALLGGLSMGHHLATALLVPGCLIYVLTTHPRQFLNPRNLLLACGAGILGLSIYLYLPLRAAFAPAFNYLGMYNSAGQFIAIDLSDPRNLWWLMRGGQFTGQMLGYTVQDLVTETRNFGVQLAQSFFVLGLAPGLLGLASLFRRNWQFALALSAMFLLNAGFYIAYRVIDKNTMFLPAYVIWAIWLAAGYQQILTWAGDGTGAVIGRRLLHGAICAVVLAACLWNLPLVSRAGDDSARLRGESALATVEANALIFGWWETVPLIEYLQLVEGQRPDVQAINRFLISETDMQRLIAREAAVRPVYIDSPTSTILHSMRVIRVGPLYRIVPREESK